MYNNTAREKTEGTGIGYDAVNIANNIPLQCTGTVYFAACSSDDYNVSANGDWVDPHNRGWCLITRITATVHNADGTTTQAAPYTSSGTSYSDFAIIRVAGGYAVTRVTTETIG